MSLTALPPQPQPSALEQTPAKHHPHRWRSSRAGIVNVWYYYDTEFTCSGGRWVLRGTNGSGKSRALEMLLPFVLDGDRRKMDATGAGKVRLQDLMKAGGDGKGNRLGYLWLELVRDLPEEERTPGGPDREFLTLGALVRFSYSAGEAKVWYFTTGLRVGDDLPLMAPDRTLLSRDGLTELVGADRVTDSAETHRDRVRTQVFGLTGESGRERFAGLLQLLYTLRSPDVGNRIEEGRLPQILSDALPPLSENALLTAGEQLDGLAETRAAQDRLDEAAAAVATFLRTYRGYATAVLTAAAEQARDAAGQAEGKAAAAAAARQTHADLTTQAAQVQTQLAELEGACQELEATITGIRTSRAYADARDLDERARKLAAMARTAEASLGAAATARSAEQDAVEDAQRRAVEVRDAAEAAATALDRARHQLTAAGATAALPEAVSATTTPGPVLAEPVRTARDRDPEPLARPVPDTLEIHPVDLDAAGEQVRRVTEAARARGEHAGTRLTQAVALERAEEQVRAAEDRAGEAAGRAEDADTEARAAETARDDTAVALAQAWRDWTGAPATAAALGPVDWAATAAHAVLVDLQALTGPDPAELVEELGRLPEQVGDPVRQELSDAIAELDAADREQARTRAALEAEQAHLRADHDPAPDAPTWLAAPPAGAVPLWQAVDFTDALDPAQRAGLEAALLASGLLLGCLHPDGTLRAGDGQLLLRAQGPAAASPLSAVLVPDPAAAVPATLVHQVLDRIGYGPHSHPTWVDATGSWAHGPLTGAHSVAAARHIGAAARAAARAARLEEIADALAALAAAAAQRAEQRRGHQQRRDDLAAHLRTAPAGQALLVSAARAEDQAGRARKLAAAARQADLAAQEQRRQWVHAAQEHRAACASFALPADAEALRGVRQEAGTAVLRCQAAGAALTELGRRAGAHASALERTHGLGLARARVEASAETDWQRWHTEAAQVAAVRASLGAEPAAVRTELARCERQLEQDRAALEEARRQDSALTAKVSAAQVQSQVATREASDAQSVLEQRAGELLARVALPGLAEAATAEPPSLALPQVDPATVRAAVKSLLAALGRAPAVDATTLLRAQQTLVGQVDSTFDVLPTTTDGVHLVELLDATGRRTVAAAAAELAHQSEQGRAALTEREREVFSKFVLDGVGDELRRRLRHASALVEAMNTSLASIRTSHGIGVTLRWDLAESASPALTRIRDLVRTSGDLRTPAQSAELADLLKAQVDAEFARDASAGYAAHLQAALDYRTWHTMEVIILGPAPGQTRRISRRARLSQGETRFVSYVSLFAAVDAYLSGLPDTGRALRLLLLDDAFAKVDDRTIGELMGLLVRLDVDFAMTGHALWGFYPQVPALDCYEVRRREGTAAVTTHTHWDGRHKHLQVAR